MLGVNTLVSLESDGAMLVKATIALKWKDVAWSWETNTTSGWALPEHILVPARNVWHPRFLLANCESDNCIVEPRNDTRVIIDNNGTILSILEPLLQASCEMNLWVCKRKCPFVNWKSSQTKLAANINLIINL